MSDAFMWIAAHEPPVEPRSSRVWKRLTLTFTFALVWGGLCASVWLQWLEQRKGKR